MSDSDDEPVGYGRPPKHGQFQKGQTGNAKGRPSEKAKRAAAAVRSQSLADDILRAELREQVTIRDGKGTRKLTKQELVVKAQVKSAAAGNPIAQKEVIRQARELEERDAERRRLAEEEAAELYRLGVGYRARRVDEWAEAQALGEEPKEPWPHPDDIILFPDTKRWIVRGPISERDVPFFEWIRSQREQMFWLMVEQFRQRGGVTKLCSIYSAGMFDLDRKLPKRWQLGDSLADVADLCVHLDLEDISARKREWQETVRLQRILLGIPAEDKEIRKAISKVMRPLVQQLGFKSLAHFERSWRSSERLIPQTKSTPWGSAMP